MIHKGDKANKISNLIIMHHFIIRLHINTHSTNYPTNVRTKKLSNFSLNSLLN